jgi:CO/xanthine dehydrogenase FAD-binding subunit
MPQDIRMALASVAPTVLRCFNTEALLRNHAINPTLIALARTELSREISPIDDLRSTARYRRRVALNLLEEFLLTLGPQPLTPTR